MTDEIFHFRFRTQKPITDKCMTQIKLGRENIKNFGVVLIEIRNDKWGQMEEKFEIGYKGLKKKDDNIIYGNVEVAKIVKDDNKISLIPLIQMPLIKDTEKTPDIYFSFSKLFVEMIEELFESYMDNINHKLIKWE